MALVRYRCCICGENIDENSKLDPCGVTIFSNLGKPEGEQLEQMFFCHYRCFKGSLDYGTSIHLNFEDQK